VAALCQRNMQVAERIHHMRGATQVRHALERLDVAEVFGLPGVHNLSLWAELRDAKVRVVGVRHEQTAVYAADGAARATGRLGVAITTTGPGAANALGATGEAMESKSPVLVIATDIATAHRRRSAHRGALHETRDQAAMFAPVVKEVFRAARAEDLAELVTRAAAVALAPSTGPVYLEIPTDLLDAPAGLTPEVTNFTTSYGYGSDHERESLQAVAAWLKEAERPLIWVGGGAMRDGAASAVAGLAADLAAPVIETYLARGLMPVGHPCRIGLPPHVPEVGALWDEADLVLSIGSDLDGMMTQNWRQPQPRRLIAINTDPADAAKNYSPDLVLVGRATPVCEAISAELTPSDGLEDVSTRLAAVRTAWRERLERDDPDVALFLDTMAAAIPDDTVVVCDMCIPGYWLAGFHPIARPRRLAYPMGWGTLGFAFPASLGAAVTQASPVLCVCGDGGFLFACGELATAAQEQIPLTILLVDNGGYGMLRFDQRGSTGGGFGTDLLTPDFALLASAFGVAAEVVGGPGPELGEALGRHLGNGKPSMVILKADFPPPPTTSPRWYR
jgi:thiamine pyrophosphate-dependent acetolactate synthase large subunit-like protein